MIAAAENAKAQKRKAAKAQQMVPQVEQFVPEASAAFAQPARAEEDEVVTVVIDNSTFMMKAGFAGDDGRNSWVFVLVV